MRAVRVADHGDPGVLTVEEIDRPEPRPDEVLVRVIAAAVNPVDTYFRDGSYTPVELPFTPGVDVAGEVIGTGEGVEGFASGQTVFGTGIGNADYHGGYAEYATVPVDRVVQLPDGADPIQAGAAGVVGCTAWRALIDHGDLTPGDTCLVHGGSGGVGHVAVQLAAFAGADVISTASPDYADRVEELGADTVLRYDRDDLAAAIQDHTEDGVNVMLDHRLDDYFSLDAAVAAQDARIVGIGENDPHVTLNDATAARSRDVQYRLMSMFNTPDLRVPLRRIGAMLANGAIEIHVDRTYTLDEAATAHADLFAESFLGKAAIVPES